MEDRRASTYRRVSSRQTGVAIGLVAACLFGFVLSRSADATESELISDARPPISVEEMAERYSAQIGAPYADALRRMKIQQAVSGLPEALMTSLGAQYGGVWIDAATGDVRVGLLAPADASVVKSALTARGLSTVAALVPVATSLRDLEAAQYTVSRELAGASDGGVTSVTIDQHANRVVVTLNPKASSTDRNVASEVARSFARGTAANGPPLPPLDPTPFGDASRELAAPQPARRVVATVEVQEGSETTVQTQSCGNESCSLPLRAGVRTRTTRQGSQALCSAGFVSTWWSGSQTDFFIEDAGHCVAHELAYNWEAAAYPANVWHIIGTHWSWRFGTCCGEPSSQNGELSIDGAIIEMSYGHYWTEVLAPALWMHGWPTGTEWSVTQEARPYEGEYGCRSGATSTYSCGTVGGTDVVVFVENHTVAIGNEMEVRGACSQEGDSGGPFVNGGIALGVLSAAAASGPCITWYAKATDIKNWFGTSVFT